MDFHLRGHPLIRHILISRHGTTFRAQVISHGGLNLSLKTMMRIRPRPLLMPGMAMAPRVTLTSVSKPQQSCHRCRT